MPAGKQVLDRRLDLGQLFPSDAILRCCFQIQCPWHLFIPHILPKPVTLWYVVIAMAFDVGQHGHSLQRPSWYFLQRLPHLPTLFSPSHYGSPSTLPPVCHAVTFSQRAHSDLVHRRSCWCEARACVRECVCVCTFCNSSFTRSLQLTKPETARALARTRTRLTNLVGSNLSNNLFLYVHLCVCSVFSYSDLHAEVALVALVCPLQKTLSHLPVPMSPNRP